MAPSPTKIAKPLPQTIDEDLLPTLLADGQSPSVGFDPGRCMTAVTFSANGKNFMCSFKSGVQVRRAEDRKEMATIEAEKVTCLAASKDSRWIAAGTGEGEVLMWDAETYERVLKGNEFYAIVAVDFSPSSSHLISASLQRATVWDVTTCKQTQTLAHNWLIAAKYSPQGDRFATATRDFIYVWDSNLVGHLLVVIPVQMTSSRNKSLLWFGNHLFVISDSTIKQFEASTGSAVAEWRVPHSKDSCIAIPQHGTFIAYAAKRAVTFWNTSTRTQSGIIQHPQEVSSLAFSPDGRVLAIGGLDGEVTIQDLGDGLPSHYFVRVPPNGVTIKSSDSVPRTIETNPFLFLDAEASLTDMIPSSGHQSLIRVLIKRSKAYVASGSWQPALNDANRVIELDPLSPWGYERKHAALHKAGDYENAARVFEAMLSKISQSPDPDISRLYRHYINPTKARAVIRRAVRDATRDSPRVLINTVSGRLLDKSEQAMAFESLPIFSELVSSMTTNIDHARIQNDVTRYYRYAMLSHTWEDNEPLFEKVMHIVVYDLEESPTNDKLRMFCKITRDAGLHWAWSDTCCIGKGDGFVLQEALDAMFKWYEGSALTLVLLRGVRPLSRRGDLVKSFWNSRMWTFQEYHASKVVRFYNEDWTLYKNLDIPNHKESPEIIAEMEEAMGVSVQTLMKLQPGLNDIREKLCLVSNRETTLIEDAAYSLFGIFCISLPIKYGEGNQALGRLLAHLLTISGDASILAWSGKSGSFNSCLPGNIRVFSQLPTSHIPPPMTGAEMDIVAARLRKTLNLTSVIKFYDRLSELPVPSFSGKWMKLPCIVFELGPLSVSRSRNGSEQVFRAQTAELGVVEIRTEEALSQFHALYLVHPWIDFLFDRQPVGSVVETPDEPSDQSSIDEPPLLLGPSGTIPAAPQSRIVQLASRLRPSGRSPTRPQNATSLRLPSSYSQTDGQMRNFQVLARLRQPFGALLLTRSRGNTAAYRRVAAESLITIRVEEMTPTILDNLIDSVSVLDVL